MTQQPEYEWYCEECGNVQYQEPARKEKFKGYEGTVELWFCSECSIQPYF